MFVRVSPLFCERLRHSVRRSSSKRWCGHDLVSEGGFWRFEHPVASCALTLVILARYPSVVLGFKFETSSWLRNWSTTVCNDQSDAQSIFRDQIFVSSRVRAPCKFVSTLQVLRYSRSLKALRPFEKFDHSVMSLTQCAGKLSG